MLPSFIQNFSSNLTSLFFDFLLGVKLHHLFLKSSENPDSGPLSSVPAIGGEEIQDTLLGIFFSIKEIIEAGQDISKPDFGRKQN